MQMYRRTASVNVLYCATPFPCGRDLTLIRRPPSLPGCWRLPFAAHLPVVEDDVEAEVPAEVEPDRDLARP